MQGRKQNNLLYRKRTERKWKQMRYNIQYLYFLSILTCFYFSSSPLGPQSETSVSLILIPAHGPAAPPLHPRNVETYRELRTLDLSQEDFPAPPPLKTMSTLPRRHIFRAIECNWFDWEPFIFARYALGIFHDLTYGIFKIA
jgi:hypothetical protein